ncbi:MAG: hypothetical protein IJR80_01035, partial [Treponema sp.]|nr:hypothetical protein [Treponema sp.]
MKKLAKLFALTASLTALIFSGCSNLVDDATIEGDSIKPDGSKTLTIFATGDSDSITFTPQNGRMILPDALDGNGLVFYLLGTDEISGLTITTKEVNFVGTSSDGRTGTVEVDLKTSKYKLELYAVEKAKKFTPSGTYSSDIVTLVGDATHDGVAVFKATASVDMRYNEKVSFYLTPYTLSGKGTLKLTLTTDWDIPSPYSTAGNIKYGLYDLVTGNAVTGTEQTSVAGDITSNKLAVTYVGNGATITSGTYNFKVTFINGTKNYVWSDTIVILYNRETAAAISIPNVIGVMPKEPTAFTAKFSVPENPISGYYDVEFLWEASGTNNEQYFQLELL